MSEGFCALSKNKICSGVFHGVSVYAPDGEYAGVEQEILKHTESGTPVRLTVTQSVPKEIIYALGKTDYSILQFSVDMSLKNPKGLWLAMQRTNYCGIVFLLHAYNIFPGAGHQAHIFDIISRFQRFGGVGRFFFRFYDGETFPQGADISRMEKIGRVWKPTPAYATEFVRRLTIYQLNTKGFRYGICGITNCEKLFQE